MLLKRKRKYIDTDYILLSGMIWELEPKLINAEIADKLLREEKVEDCLKIIGESLYEYGSFEDYTQQELEEKIVEKRNKNYKMLADYAPYPECVDVFRSKYDYHNAKVLVKSPDGNIDDSIMSDAGIVSAQDMKEAYLDGNYAKVPQEIALTIKEAKEVLEKTKDPQMADNVLDKAYFKNALKVAEEVGGEYFNEFIRLQIDGTNLRTAVRLMRMDITGEYAQGVMLEDGDVPVSRLVQCCTQRDSVSSIYENTMFAEAAKLGDKLKDGGSFSEFEKAIENVYVEKAHIARISGFGENVIIGFMFGLEQEFTTLRTIISGKLSGQSEETIRERLRDLYV